MTTLTLTPNEAVYLIPAVNINIGLGYRSCMTRNLMDDSALIYHTPNELYADRGVKDERGVYELIGPDRQYFPMIDIRLIDRDAMSTQTRLVQRIHGKSRMRGYRCYWQLSSFWLDGRPFMIAQEAGPDGKGYFDLIITNAKLHSETVDFLRCFERTPPHRYEREVPVEVPIPNLTSFFGASLAAVRARLNSLFTFDQE